MMRNGLGTKLGPTLVIVFRRLINNDFYDPHFLEPHITLLCSPDAL